MKLTRYKQCCWSSGFSSTKTETGETDRAVLQMNCNLTALIVLFCQNIFSVIILKKSVIDKQNFRLTPCGVSFLAGHWYLDISAAFCIANELVYIPLRLHVIYEHTSMNKCHFMAILGFSRATSEIRSMATDCWTTQIWIKLNCCVPMQHGIRKKWMICRWSACIVIAPPVGMQRTDAVSKQQ